VLKETASMMHTFRWYEVAGLVAALAVVATYGTTARGSDAALGPAVQKQVTLAFPLALEPDAGYGSGRLQYADPTASVYFHGIMRGAPADNGVQLARVREFSGDYTTQPGTAAGGGKFYVVVYQNSNSGSAKADTYEISLQGGAYEGYYYAGRWDGKSLTAPD
jgi:hypothetical protein